MTFLLAITIAMLIVCGVMIRVADKQIADRDQRINALYVDVQSSDAQCDEWRATAARLTADLSRQVDLRVVLDDALEEAHQRAKVANREAIAAQQEAYRERVRANRAEGALRMIAQKVGAPPDHPDVGDKIMERLTATRGSGQRLLS